MRLAARLHAISPILAIFALGCGSSEGSSTTGSTSASVDETLQSSETDVPAGGDLVTCTYVRGANASDEDVATFVLDQPEGGHHLIVYAVDHAIDLPAGPCSQGGQPSWIQILATQSRHDLQTFPSGVGYHVKAHQQYVLETHFINTSNQARKGSSSVGVKYAPAGSVHDRAASFYFGTQNIDVPAKASWSNKASCKPPVAMKVRTMFGHEHAHGTRVAVDYAPSGGSKKNLYASSAWDAPPVATFDGGLDLGVADALEVTCDWTNDGAGALRYPHEMCYALGYFWPSDGNEVFCISGGKKDACECQSTFTDAGPGGAAIELSVGWKAGLQAKNDFRHGAPVYCSLFRSEDYGALGPKQGAKPYYFTQAVDQPLATSQDRLKLSFEDVTPASYAAVCTMDTIGGGFLPGPGDLANLKRVDIVPKAGETAKAELVLDLELP